MYETLFLPLRQQLESLLTEHRCVSGTFRAELPGGRLILTMHGTRADSATPIFFWEWPNPVRRAAVQYFEAHAELQAIEIHLDITAGTAEYVTETRAEYAARQQKQAEDAARERQNAQLERKRQLSQDTTPIGTELATRVAAKIRQAKFFGYNHRDYCGMGLEIHDGKICYGQLQDGGMYPPDITFDTDETFIHWLSLQSNASLANLDSPEPFYWGNQTITRQRLEEFLVLSL